MSEHEKPKRVYKPNVPKHGLIPTVNRKMSGKVWKWDDVKRQASQLLAEGYSKRRTAELLGIKEGVIKDWSSVKEFIEYTNEIIFETGVAVKSNRIAKMKRMADELEKVFYAKAEQLLRDPTEERLKDISHEFREMLKQIATEQEDYYELQKTHHEITGSLGMTKNIVVKRVEEFLESMPADEQEAMRNEFSKVADRAIAELHD